MKIRALPEAERPLEKARAAGIRHLSNAELLALIIRSGTSDQSAIQVAENLLSSLDDGLVDFGNLDFEEVKSIRGIGDMKAGALLAAIELGKRTASSRRPERAQIRMSGDAAGLFMERLRYEKREHFVTCLLDSKSCVIGEQDVSIGELNRTMVHPREVFSMAVRKSAASILVLHNHPSGDPEPSREDLLTTRRLEICGRILGIELVDHLIIGDGRYVSFRDRGLLGEEVRAEEIELGWDIRPEGEAAVSSQG